MRLSQRIKEWKPDLSIFQKLLISYVCIVIIPLLISSYLNRRTMSDMVIEQVSTETMHSIELVSKSVDSVIKKMYSIALYVNEDSSLREMIDQEFSDQNSDMNNAVRNLRKLERINRFNGFINNITFNMIDAKAYISIITSAGTQYANWAYESGRSKAFEERTGKTNGEIWIDVERNYAEKLETSPYVFTLGKDIESAQGIRRFGTFLISIPENEISMLMAPNNREQTRLILDSNGKIISSTKKEWMEKDFDSIFNDVVFPSALAGSFLIMDTNGRQQILSYRALNNWRIVDIKSYDDVTEQISIVNNRVMLINIFCALIFLAASAMLAQGISKPLHRLAKIIEKPDFLLTNTSVKKSRRDELGILEDSFYKMRENSQSLLKQNIEIERKKRDAEFKALQAQISPHFLFNTLNAVRWAAINNHNQKAADMVFSLSNLLRMSIVKGDEMITLREEIENLRHYIAIFQLRHDITFDFVCNVAPELTLYRLPKLLLQPLVENAILHGFEDCGSDCVIEVSGRVLEEHVLLCVKDNGQGLQPECMQKSGDKMPKFSGIGIDNIDERIKLHFGQEYSLTLKENPDGGVIAQLILPLPEYVMEETDDKNDPG